MAERPHWRISALNKNTNESGEIGVAWNNEKGHISIKFNPFVNVPTGQDFVISMFPIAPKEENTKIHLGPPAYARPDNSDDEIPF
jgi:hypothetical protein